MKQSYLLLLALALLIALFCKWENVLAAAATIRIKSMKCHPALCFFAVAGMLMAAKYVVFFIQSLPMLYHITKVLQVYPDADIYKDIFSGQEVFAVRFCGGFLGWFSTPDQAWSEAWTYIKSNSTP